MQAVFLLEKLLLELGKAAKLAFGREVCQAKLHPSSASIRWPVWALDPSKGPYPNTVVWTQVLSCCLARLGPGPFKGPYPSSVLSTISSGCGVKQDVGIWSPVQGFHLEWNPKP